MAAMNFCVNYAKLLVLMSTLAQQVSSVNLRECPSIDFASITSICNLCGDSQRESNVFCNEAPLEEEWPKKRQPLFGNSWNGTRCCLDSDCGLGLDLRRCHSLSVSEREVLKNTKLNFLITEADKACFGGDASWLQRSTTPTVKVCTNQIDLCTNVTCPDNSHCFVNDSNSRVQCLCDEGWHGYKCLRYGSFATSTWLVSIGTSTLVIIIVAWFSQTYSRRQIKRRINNYGTQ